MILYALTCESGHGFESWFRDSAAFDQQKQQGLIACPNCASFQIEKAIMAPRISLATDTSSTGPEPRQPLATIPPGDAETRAMIRAFHTHLEANADHVGPRFAEEARRIHYGEAKSRAIYGDAGESDIRSLLDEGVPIAPIPRLPDEHN